MEGFHFVSRHYDLGFCPNKDVIARNVANCQLHVKPKGKSFMHRQYFLQFSPPLFWFAQKNYYVSMIYVAHWISLPQSKGEKWKKLQFYECYWSPTFFFMIMRILGFKMQLRLSAFSFFCQTKKPFMTQLIKRKMEECIFFAMNPERKYHIITPHY